MISGSPQPEEYCMESSLLFNYLETKYIMYGWVGWNTPGASLWLVYYYVMKELTNRMWSLVFCTMLNLINTFTYIYGLVTVACHGLLHIPSRIYTWCRHVYIREAVTYIYVLDTGEYHVPTHIPKRIYACRLKNSKYGKNYFGATRAKSKKLFWCRTVKTAKALNVLTTIDNRNWQLVHSIRYWKLCNNL